MDSDVFLSTTIDVFLSSVWHVGNVVYVYGNPYSHISSVSISHKHSISVNLSDTKLAFVVVTQITTALLKKIKLVYNYNL